MFRRTLTACVVLVAIPLFPQPRASEVSSIFVDPTARVTGRDHITFGEHVYVAPFAQLLAGSIRSESGHEAQAVDDQGQRGPSRRPGRISIGGESNVQDNVLLNATAGDGGDIAIGEQVILAHGAAVVGPARIGTRGRCPDSAETCPTFVGFNAVVDGAMVHRDSMILTMARVAPGVVIPSGVKVLPGKYVRTQAEVVSDTVPVTEADRAFMAAVIEVNVQFVAGYKELESRRRSNVYGINFDPNTAFNPGHDLPRLAGLPTRDPTFRNRIIGDVATVDSRSRLSQRMGHNISLRADEGDPLKLGQIGHIHDRVSIHALEFTQVEVGDRARLGFHSVIHGGGPLGPAQSTVVGDNFTLGPYAAMFRAAAGDNVTVGRKSLVQGTVLPPGTVVPACTVIVETLTYPLEWCGVPFPGPQAPHGFRGPYRDGDCD